MIEDLHCSAKNDWLVEEKTTERRADVQENSKIIVHIDFTGTYNESTNYQENLLPRENRKHGHKVFFIGTCYMWDNGKEKKVDPSIRVLDDGVVLYRLPYKHIVNDWISRKVRAVPGVYSLLEKLNPDIIMIHCLQSFAYLQVAKYKRNHSNVVLYADSHTDKYNSARNFISRIILHGMFYRGIFKIIEKDIDRVFYLSPEIKDFLTEIYKCPESKMELMVAGGTIPDREQYDLLREKYRKELEISDDEVLFIHTGKFNSVKKTQDVIECFSRCKSGKSKLVLVGVMNSEIESEYLNHKQSNILYIGWKSGSELIGFLCAADVYLQPGSQSATAEQAACCRCAMVLYPYLWHKLIYGDEVKYVVNVNELENAIAELAENSKELKDQAEKIFVLAKEKLDYSRIARRIEK